MQKLSFSLYIAALICFAAGILGAVAYIGFGDRFFETFAPVGTILGLGLYLLARRIGSAEKIQG